MSDEEKLLGYLKRVTADLHQTRQRLARPRHTATTPSRSSRWAAASRAGWRPRRSVAAARRRARRHLRLPHDRGWDLGRPYDPDPGRPAPATPARAASCTTPADFDAAFFGISPARGRSPPTRSSGSCWRPAWEALERAGIDPAPCAAAAPASSPAPIGRTTPRLHRRPRTSSGYLLPATRPASPPAGSPTPSASKAPPSPSTPPAPPPWSPSTWRRRRCAPASATSRWPAASP